MGSFSKWLGAGIGFVSGGPIGAIIGFALGSVLDASTREDFEKYARKYRSDANIRQSNTQSGDDSK